MKKKLILVIFTIVIFIISFFYLGVFYEYKDHTERYTPFIKQYPTSQFIFYNPILCGECDFRSYDSFTTEGPKKKFRDLCYYKYGLEDIQKCEDLFNPEKNKK